MPATKAAAPVVTDVVKSGVDNVAVQLDNSAALAAVAKALDVKIEDGKQPLAPKSIASKPSREAKVSEIGGLKIEER